ncbi:serine hydrolase [Spirosoma sp. KNUC1025]|uniref:serine hydrolase n=1 Tax=Spirosoma sp. KNUC1025 TaxID=2894082 RepID=UPI0038682170
MWRWITPFGLLWLCSILVSCTDHQEPGLSSERRVQIAVDSVRRVLEDSLGQSVPSMNVLIQTPTHTYFASAVSLGRQPLTPTTYFRFASNTKNFTATAILKMYQDGWLDYQAHITDLIPGPIRLTYRTPRTGIFPTKVRSPSSNCSSIAPGSMIPITSRFPV